MTTGFLEKWKRRKSKGVYNNARKRRGIPPPGAVLVPERIPANNFQFYRPLFKISIRPPQFVYVSYFLNCTVKEEKEGMRSNSRLASITRRPFWSMRNAQRMPAFCHAQDVGNLGVRWGEHHWHG